MADSAAEDTGMMEDAEPAETAEPDPTTTPIEEMPAAAPSESSGGCTHAGSGRAPISAVIVAALAMLFITRRRGPRLRG